jgi:hypothetical protein
MTGIRIADNALEHVLDLSRINGSCRETLKFMNSSCIRESQGYVSS